MASMLLSWLQLSNVVDRPHFVCPFHSLMGTWTDSTFRPMNTAARTLMSICIESLSQFFACVPRSRVAMLCGNSVFNFWKF